MTAAQIEILLKDGDISDQAGERFCSNDSCKFLSLNGDAYFISNEMYQIFEKLFDFYSNDTFFELGIDKCQIDSIIKKENEYRNQNKNARLKILEDILEVEIQKLKKLIGTITIHNNPVKIKQEWFFDFFLDNGAAIVKYLKFDFLKGKKLSSFTMEGDSAFLLQYSQFERYYQTLEMKRIYDCISVEKSIKYIQGLISEIDKPIAKKFKSIKYPDKLEDVFTDPIHFKNAINALKELKVIDKNNCNCIGRNLKSVMNIWVKFLKDERKYLKHIPDEKLVILLNKFFTNLDISEKSNGKQLRTAQKSASNKYLKKLTALIR